MQTPPRVFAPTERPSGGISPSAAKQINKMPWVHPGHFEAPLWLNGYGSPNPPRVDAPTRPGPKHGQGLNVGSTTSTAMRRPRSETPVPGLGHETLVLHDDAMRAAPGVAGHTPWNRKRLGYELGGPAGEADRFRFPATFLSRAATDKSRRAWDRSRRTPFDRRPNQWKGHGARPGPRPCPRPPG